MDQNNLILVDRQFYLNGHDLNRDGKFTIIERIRKDVNIKLIKKKKIAN